MEHLLHIGTGGDQGMHAGKTLLIVFHFTLAEMRTVAV